MQPMCGCLCHVAQWPSPWWDPWHLGMLTSSGSLSHKSCIQSSLGRFDGSSIQLWLLRCQWSTWSSPFLHLQLWHMQRHSDWAWVNWIWWAKVWHWGRGKRGRGISAPAGMKMMSLPLGWWLDSVEHISHFLWVSSGPASCCLGAAETFTNTLDLM